MKLRKLLIPFVFGGFVTAFAFPAAAECTCEKEDRSASANSADVIFWGKGKVDKDGDFVFRVSSSFKGTRRKRKHTLVPKESCSVKFEEGTNYIVFAKKEEKRSISVSSCSATTALEKAPYTETTWSAADQLPYGAGRRTVARHQRDRDNLTGRALDKVEYAAKKCESVWKKGKDKASLRINVRFDVQPDGKYEANILKYQGADSAKQSETMACLEKRLDGKKFKKFRGNAVSVRAYWRIDRIDSSMQQEKKSSVVKPFMGDASDEEDDELADVPKKSKKGG